MANRNEWIIRGPTGQDLAFIYSTWLNSMWCGYSSKKSGIRKTAFFAEYPKTIDQILKTSQVALACNPGDPSVIYGYIVYGEDCLYSIFIKEPFRKFGIGSSLLNYSKGIPHGQAD